MTDESPYVTLVFNKTGRRIPDPVRSEISKRNPGDLLEFQLDPQTASILTETEAGISAALLNTGKKHRVLLYGFGATEALPGQLIMMLSATRVFAIDRVFEKNGWVVCERHRPHRERKSAVLIVFPGVIVPVTMGSHRRAFQMIASLAAEGRPVDLLITGGSAESLNGAKPLLYQIACRISHYHNRRPPLDFRLVWRKRVERCLRMLTGRIAPPPDLFEERLNTAASHSACHALRRLIEAGYYRTVIVNYAWMANIRKLLTPVELAGVTWICDTHDVQFVRNATDNQKERRFFRSEEREKERELEVLRSFDKVLAISEPDHEALVAELGPEKSMFIPTGFDYSLGEPRCPNPDQPVFGFIGRKMRANEKSFLEILSNWWPAIHHRWPQSTLRVAGTICESKAFDPSNLPDGVVLEGLVPNLAAWYRSLDVSLNPVLVRGGINFKSVEALMAGKLLVTNAMGGACLGDPSLATIADTGREVVESVEQAMADPSSYLKDRIANRDKARQIFGDTQAIRPLIDCLLEADRPWTTKRDVTSPQRVLIQCGDHLENRVRVTALARAIRARGHHPLVMVYKHEHVAPFLARGIDALALEDFEVSDWNVAKRSLLARRIRSLNHSYRGVCLNDVATIAKKKSPASFQDERRRTTIETILRNIDRCVELLKHARPDQLVIWNGHTGWVANILRHISRKQGMPRYFLERSVFPDAVFIDPAGTNGDSELSRLSLEELVRLEAAASPRPPEAISTPRDEDQIKTLKESGPWKDAHQLILVPLQVQSDTNILLYSPDCETMCDFVQQVYQSYSAPGVAFIVRPHPEEVLSDLALPILPGVYVDSSGNLETWMDAADLIVTINSTVGMQGLLKGKPVVALGHGIYTGKGFTCGDIPSREAIERLWNILMHRYTCIPGTGLPQCMDDSLPALDLRPWVAVNTLGVDPDECLENALAVRNSVRCETLERGELQILIDGIEGKTLDLSYRQTKQPLTENDLVSRLAGELDLGHEIRIRTVVSKTGPGQHVQIRTGRGGEEALPQFDKYGWILPPGIANAMSTRPAGTGASDR